jgi:hypothetical protein
MPPGVYCCQISHHLYVGRSRNCLKTGWCHRPCRFCVKATQSPHQSR